MTLEGLNRFSMWAVGAIVAASLITQCPGGRRGGMTQAEIEREIARTQAAREALAEASTPQPEPEKPDLELLDYEAVGTDIGGEITGTIRNNTAKRYNYAQATFVLLDNDGNQVGSALANVNGLEAGRTWKFKAVAFTDFDRFKLDQITGY